MICPVCKGEVRRGTTDFPVELERGSLIIKDVPADVCGQCGEEFIPDEVMEALEKTIEAKRRDKARSKAEVKIVSYEKFCKIMNVREAIDRFRSEIETAIRTFYAYDAYLKLLSEKKYVNLINKNVHFWRIFGHSVHAEMFIAIGRLYDEGKDAFSFQKFIQLCRDNIDEFGVASFEKRRLDESGGNRPDYLDKYLREAYSVRIEDIDTIAALAKPCTKRMKEIYKQIRHKLIAHPILHELYDSIEVSDLYKTTNMDEIETALLVLWTVYEQISQMYLNCRKPELEIKPYPYKDEIYGGIKLAVCEPAFTK
jgi:YgiT-type zinc finger domain-containing protein